MKAERVDRAIWMFIMKIGKCLVVSCLIHIHMLEPG